MKRQIAQMHWDDYRVLPEGEKAKYLTSDGRLYDVLYSQQFTRELLDHLYVLTNKIRLVSKTREGAEWLSTLLSTKKALLYFIQPSTRTFLSFWSACSTLGMKVIDVRSPETSSEMKGESAEDNLRTISSYFDILITRHPERGYADKASFILGKTRRPIPTINAGSGKDQHPTQALLDIFSLRKSFDKLGGIEGKTIMMVGDLKRGRTVRSLCYLLSNFPGIRLIFSSPEAFKMENDIKDFLKRRHVSFLETEEFASMIPDADAIYMTRLQDEHDTGNESKTFDVSKFAFRQEHLKILRPNGVLLHPLPRRGEIEESVDLDPRAMYWRQVRNGMWTRVALLAHIFGVEKKILDK